MKSNKGDKSKEYNSIKLSDSSDASKITYRLIADFYTDNPYIVGTATAVCGSLAITARHVLDEILQRKGKVSDGSGTKANSSITAVRADQSNYQFWKVIHAWPCQNTDIAFLKFAVTPDTTTDGHTPVHYSPIFRSFPLRLDSEIIGFGYRKSKIECIIQPNGGRHYNIDDELIQASGRIKEIYPLRRDNAMISWPSFRVNSQFDLGMSGGPVFDSTGAICGIVCAGRDSAQEDEEPISYVSTIWPIFENFISAHLPGRFSEGTNYRAIELVRAGLVHVIDRAELAKWMALRIPASE